MRRKDEDRLRLERLERAVEEIQHALQRIELMFLMKDPSIPAGADAYEGLRRSLILAREDRMARLVDLARIDASLRRSDGGGDASAVLDELLVAAGVDRVDEPGPRPDPGVFDVFGESSPGTVAVVLEPAYVHAETGAVVRSGRVRHEVAASGNRPETPPSSDGSVEVAEAGDGAADGGDGDRTEERRSGRAAGTDGGAREGDDDGRTGRGGGR